MLPNLKMYLDKYCKYRDLQISTMKCMSKLVIGMEEIDLELDLKLVVLEMSQILIVQEITVRIGLM